MVRYPQVPAMSSPHDKKKRGFKIGKGFLRPLIQHKIFDGFYLIASDKIAPISPEFLCVDVSDLRYDSFRDDFGPMNLGETLKFVDRIEYMFVKSNYARPIALHVTVDEKELTNAAYLIGAYMLLQLGMQPDEIEARFEPLSTHLVSFRDVSPGQQNFHLYLRDCWAGLWRANQLGWIKRGPQGFDATEYVYYGSPFNADLHEVVPGKFVAFRGPKDLPDGQLWSDVSVDGRFSHRDLSPQYYVDILHQFEVQAVVRLNAPEYDSAALTRAGLGFVDLFFEDCTCPPPDVVAKFMMIAEGLPGAVAVHCKSGLGRTGTLIALYMMQHYDFTAREAMGWLRVVRPGSVIGPQQQYLVDREAVMRRTRASFARHGPVVSLRGEGPAAVARLIAEAQETVDARLRAAARAAAAARPRRQLDDMGVDRLSTSAVQPLTAPSSPELGAADVRGPLPWEVPPMLL